MLQQLSIFGLKKQWNDATVTAIWRSLDSSLFMQYSIGYIKSITPGMY